MAVTVSRFKVTPVMNGAIRRMFFKLVRERARNPAFIGGGG